MGAYTCSLHTHGSMFGRVANPEFRSLLVPHALTNRAVCQLLQVAPSNKWSWVRADNTGHVDLVNLGRGILQSHYEIRASRVTNVQSSSTDIEFTYDHRSAKLGGNFIGQFHTVNRTIIDNADNTIVCPYDHAGYE